MSSDAILTPTPPCQQEVVSHVPVATQPVDRFMADLGLLQGDLGAGSAEAIYRAARGFLAAGGALRWDDYLLMTPATAAEFQRARTDAQDEQVQRALVSLVSLLGK